jgi:hypothetical protein
MGLVTENIYLYDVKLSSCFINAYDYNCFGEVCSSHRVEGFKMEQRAAMKFCVKLKKTVIETFELLKSGYCEECLHRTSVSEWHKSRYKMMHGNAVFQLPEQDRWKSFECLAKKKTSLYGIIC